MASTFAARTRQLIRQDALAVAEELVTGGGWSGLQMQVLADRVGVSRQTVYNEFANKAGVAHALVLKIADDILDQIDQAVAATSTLEQTWEAAITSALATASQHPLVTAVLTSDNSRDFLPAITTNPALLSHAQGRLTKTLTTKWPTLRHDLVETAADAAVRLIISHILLPAPSGPIAAERTAQLLAASTANTAATRRRADTAAPSESPRQETRQ